MNPRPTYTKNFTRTRIDHTPRLVLGTSGLGGVWGTVKENESIDAILMALEHKITAIDTAPSYANAESIVGKALQQWSGMRPYISTKVGRLKAFDAHTVLTDYSLEGVQRSIEQSLDTLGVNFIDVLFLHEPQLVPPKSVQSLLSFLLGYKAHGLIHKVGVGGNMPEFFKPFMGKGKFEAVSGFLRMNACNLDAFKGDVSFFKEREIIYYNASVLHFGLLGGRIMFDKSSFEKNSDWLTQRDIRCAKHLLEISRRLALPIAVLAFRYAMSIEEADKIVIGPTNVKQLKELLQAWSMGPLPVEVFHEISDFVQGQSLTLQKEKFG